MSKFLKRIGTSAKRFRFQLRVQDAEFAGKMDGKLQVLWARGPKIAATNFISANHDGNGERAVCLWDENLEMIVTLYENPRSKKQQYQKKPCRIYLKQRLPDSKTAKTIGRIVVDLADYVKPGSTEDCREILFDIAKCNDREPRLSVELSYKYVHDLDIDAMSVDSGSVDLGAYWEPSVTMSSANKLSSPSFDYNPKGAPHSPRQLRTRSSDKEVIPPLGLSRPASSSSAGSSAGGGTPTSLAAQATQLSNGRQLTILADESLKIPEEDKRPVTPQTKNRKSLKGRAQGVRARDIEIEYEKKIELLNERMKKMASHFETTSQRFTQIEVDYVRVKVELVDMVDTKHDLEVECMKLREKNKELEQQLAAEREKNRKGMRGLFRSSVAKPPESS